MKKAVLYMRYSSRKQDEDSIEQQRRDCIAYAAEHDIEIIKEYIDEAMSAKNDNRPDFIKMIDESKIINYDYVIVWKIDRFSRNAYNTAIYRHQLSQNGKKIITVAEPMADGDLQGLVEAIFAQFAEISNKDLSQKVKRGMISNALRGDYNGGQRLYGYKIINKKYAIDDTEAEIVKEIYQKYANGERIKTIIKWLNSININITYNRINSILKNESYIGTYHNSGCKIDNAIPAIIDKETFEKAQIIKQQWLHKPGEGKAKVAYLLAGKVFCGECGSKMIGIAGTSKTGAVHNYYQCKNAKQHKCKLKAIRKGWLEDTVIKDIMTVINDEKVVNDIAKRVTEKIKNKNTLLPALTKKKAEADTKIENLLQALETGNATEIITERIAKIKIDRDKISEAITAEIIKQKNVDEDKIKDFIRKMANIGIEQRQQLIDIMVDRITIFSDRIEITCRYNQGKTKTIAYSDSSYIENNGSPEKRNTNTRIGDDNFTVIKYHHYPFWSD